MKTLLPRLPLVDALSACQYLSGGRTTKPILSCVKLAAKGKELELSATDGEANLRVIVRGVVVERPGQVVIPADRLLRIVREMVDAEIRLEAEERQCVIRGAGSEFRVYVMNPEDFPPVPGFEDEPDVVIDGLELRRMISTTIYAAARETSRYAINGVLWKKQGKRLFAVATDGRRLARSGGNLREARSADFEVIIPARALQVVDKVFTQPRGDDPWQVSVRVTPNQVLLSSRDIVLSSILVEGNFPQYEGVIPKSSQFRARIDRMEFIGAVRRAEILTTEESRAVRMAFEPERVVLTSSAPEQGDARVELPVEYDGKPLEIGFNPTFICDALRAISNETVYFELEDAFRPGVIVGDDRNEFLYVVMPVSLSN